MNSPQYLEHVTEANLDQHTFIFFPNKSYYQNTSVVVHMMKCDFLKLFWSVFISQSSGTGQNSEREAAHEFEHMLYINSPPKSTISFCWWCVGTRNQTHEKLFSFSIFKPTPAQDSEKMAHEGSTVDDSPCSGQDYHL